VGSAIPGFVKYIPQNPKRQAVRRLPDFYSKLQKNIFLGGHHEN
jgi:hypothetical protein